MSTPENSGDWRALADQLTPEQVEDLEEYAAKIDDDAANAIVPWRLTPREVLLGRARRYCTENMLATLIGDVPTPAGVAFVDTWQEHDPQPYRILLGPERGVGRLDARVWISAAQFADGTIDDNRALIEPPYVHVQVDDDGMTADEARQFAQALIEAADEVDTWACRGGVSP
jgi:hypothetical protein